jgi:hypothetical protein
MSTKAVTYRIEEELLQRIEKAVEVLQKGNQYGTISKNSFVAGAIEKACDEILKEEFTK